MPTRRDVLRSLALVGAAAAGGPLLAGCGDTPPTQRRAALGPAGIARSNVARAAVGSAELPLAVDAVSAFTTDLYRGMAAAPGNLVASPYSVAVALAMTRNGAVGATARQMDDVLHAPALPRLNDAMNALTAQIESRSGRRERADGSKATVSLDVANSLWGQHDTVWKPAFLDALAGSYGAGMNLVDYKADPSGARELVNDWTADSTHDRIPEILPTGVVDTDTRLVLVNAIYLKAPWEQPFEPTATTRRPFTRYDGSQVQADTMSASLEGAGYARGNGWQAARLPYAGGELAMTVILPDAGGLASWEQSLDGPGLTEILSRPRPVGMLALRLPRWTFRVQTELSRQLEALGMPAAFDPLRADFSGMTTQEQLYISAVLHEAFIAVDEQGTEAAAATAVVMEGVAGSVATSLLVVDRPFVFVVHDVESLTPLFIGRVADPTA